MPPGVRRFESPRTSGNAPDIDDADRWCEVLRFGWCGVDSAHDIHPARNATEGGEALTVEVAMAAEVERGLVSDADEESLGRAVGAAARHGECAVLVQQPCRT